MHDNNDYLPTVSGQPRSNCVTELSDCRFSDSRDFGGDNRGVYKRGSGEKLTPFCATITITKGEYCWFLANVNSCSRSLYVVVRPSVCLSSVCLSAVTFVHPTQAIEIFGNISMSFGTLAISDPSVKILRRSCQGNPSVEGLNQRGVEKCSDFGPFQGYISETLQDRG